MDLQDIRLGQFSLRVLGGAGTEMTGQVEEVAGRQLFIRADHSLCIGAPVKLNWDGNTILGEVQGTHTRNGTRGYVIGVQHLVLSSAQAKPAQPQTAAPEESSLLVLMRAVRESLLVVQTPAVSCYEGRLRELEQVVGTKNEGDVAVAAAKVLAEYHTAALGEVRERIGAVTSTLHMLSVLLSDIADPRVTAVQSSLDDLRQMVAELGAA